MYIPGLPSEGKDTCQKALSHYIHSLEWSFLLKPNDKSINSSTTWEFGEAFLNSAFRALLCLKNETSSSPSVA